MSSGQRDSCRFCGAFLAVVERSEQRSKCFWSCLAVSHSTLQNSTWRIHWLIFMLLSLQFFTANILSQFLDMLVSLLEKWTKDARWKQCFGRFYWIFNSNMIFPHFYWFYIFADFLARRQHFSSIDSSAAKQLLAQLGVTWSQSEIPHMYFWDGYFFRPLKALLVAIIQPHKGTGFVQRF